MLIWQSVHFSVSLTVRIHGVENRSTLSEMKNKGFLRPLIADEWSERGCLRLMRSCGFFFFFFAFWFAHVGNWKIKASDLRLTHPVGLDIK